MTPQDLKDSILQLAIQGKLVPQRAEEGTAEELYNQIQAEKQKLIKAGKIKKEKLLPAITDDEKPFEIPQSWKWVRCGEIFSILNGDRGKNYPAKSKLSNKGSIPFISAVNLDGKTVLEDDNLLYLSQQQYDLLNNGKLKKGDIVICIRGSLGKHGKYPFKIGAIASSLAIMRLFVDDEFLKEFFMYYLDTPLFYAEIKRYDNGTAQPNLASNSLEKFLLPLPPLSEQKRIVAKIEELLPYVERYEKAYNKLQQLNKRFPGDLQKSVLQLAIQGRLVPQREEEGSAEELYKQIQAEKQKLIKAAKIKKEKPLPAITDEEKPFEIPQSWKWVRLGSISFINGGYAFKSENFKQNGVRVIRISDFNENGFINTKIVRHTFDESLEPFLIKEKDIILCMTGGTVGKSYFVKRLEEQMMTNQRVATIRSIFVYQEYINFIVLSPVIQKIIKDSKNSTNDNISMGTITSFIVPLPPLAEQKRIVAKIEEILPLCDKLK